jgi:hypothetical protein
MRTSVTNERYEAIVDAGLTFFTILVGLKLADLIDDRHGTLGDDKWPCFVMGIAVFLRYVTGSFVHQRAQHVNQPEKHDRQFLFDFAFLMAFGIIAVWACVAETVPDFLCRLMWFTIMAILWTLGYLGFVVAARAHGKPYPLKYLWWILVNAIQLLVFGLAEFRWFPPQATISVLCFGFRSLWIISGAAVLLLFADLRLQLRVHEPPGSGEAASDGPVSF